MTKLKDLTGMKFGKWTVLKRTENSRSYTKWLCKCQCGITKNVIASHLTRGNSQGCTKCMGKERRGKNHAQWKGVGDICGDFWDSIKRGANGRKGRRISVSFEISMEFAWKLFLQQDKKCALSGIPITIDYKKYNGEHTASLDRIDSSLGYTENNVQWVHKDVNMMKRTYDQDHFLDLCKKIAKHNGV